MDEELEVLEGTNPDGIDYRFVDGTEWEKTCWSCEWRNGEECNGTMFEGREVYSDDEPCDEFVWRVGL